MERDEFKQLIYDLMRGTINLEEYPVEESKDVRSEFENGMYCSNAYDEVYDANVRLCERLRTDEDKDVECIISNLFDITKHLSMKMYDYGEKYAQKTYNGDIYELIHFYETLAENKKEKFMKLLSSIQKLIISMEENGEIG